MDWIMDYKKKRSPVETALIIIIAVLFVLIAIVSALLILKPFLHDRGGRLAINRKLRLGNRYLSEMEYDKAVTEFSDVIRIDNKNTDAYVGLADAYTGLGKWSVAVENYDTALDTVRVKAGIGSAPGNNSDESSLWVQSGFVREDVLAEAGLPDVEYMTDDDLYLIAVLTYPEDVLEDHSEGGPYHLDGLKINAGEIHDIVVRRNDAIAEDVSEILAAGGSTDKYSDYMIWMEERGYDPADADGNGSGQGTGDQQPAVQEADNQETDQKEDAEKEDGPKVKWFDYIKENYIDDKGYVSLEPASKTVGENWSYPDRWDLRTGVISAQVVDLNDDGLEECAVYFFDDDFRYTADSEQVTNDPRTTLYITLLTSDETGQIIEKETRQVFYDYGNDFSDGIGGIIKFGGKKYIYTEYNSNAYYANGYDTFCTFFSFDGSSYRPEYGVGKTGGGSMEFEYSIVQYDENGDYPANTITFTMYPSDGYYSKRLLTVDDAWGEYNSLSDYDTSIMLPNYDPTRAMQLGLETITGVEPETVTLENADNLYAFGDQYISYRNSPIFTPAFHYNCNGPQTGGNGARNITVSLEDNTGLWKLVQLLFHESLSEFK